MPYPYQCLQICGNILVAASTSHLDTFSLANRVHLSSWDYTPDFKEDESTDLKSNIVPPVLEHQTRESSTVEILSGSEPLAKRLKFSDGHVAEATTSVDRMPIGSKESKSLHHHASVPNIIALAATKDGKHVIAVTGEDKNISVLALDLNGRLRPVNRRAMPKRPCSIALTADDSTIICADKFGDVYSLPLLPDSSSQASDFDSVTCSLDLTKPQQRKPFVSAANDLTIHTARNRRALQNQLRQDQRPSEKAELKFEHKLLLGHVSMLTKIRAVERDGCSYIITSDRDEHIRVSRGIPQAHIIENYCLGHEEFITELCLPTTYPNLLLSGGGDDAIYSWDWLQGSLRKKTDIRSILETVTKSSPLYEEHETTDSIHFDKKSMNVAVSSIQHLAKRLEDDSDTIIITCEGVPALFFFHLLANGSLTHYYTVKIDGNPLSTVVDTSTGTLLVSVDYVHESGSRTKVRAHRESPIQRLRVIQKADSSWTERNFETDYVDTAAENQRPSDDLRNLTNLLYNLENLRKRSGEE